MAEQFSNNAATTLTAGIDDATGNVPVTSRSAFPSSASFRIIIDSEIMLVTGGTGVGAGTFTVTRAQEGTSAAAHLIGAAVTHVLTADGLSTGITERITYGTLDANGDVGTGAGQLAIGNHTHADEHSSYSEYTEIATPSAPAANKIRFYAKDRSGISAPYVIGDDGNEYCLLASGGNAPSDAKYVTTAADAGLSAEVAIPGLAGSADIAGAGGAGTAEEYDTATTGLTWSPSDPTTVDSNTTVKSHLYVKNDNTERFGTKAWAPAGAFDARTKVFIGRLGTGQDPYWGLYIANSDASKRLLVCQYGYNVGANLGIQAFTWGGTWSQIGVTHWGNGMLYLRISRDGGNNCSFWYSANGLVWVLIGTAAYEITVAKIGFWTTAGGAINYEAVTDWLRTDV